MLKSKNETSHSDAGDFSAITTRRAMGILDFPKTLVQIPLLLQEKLEKISGVSSVEINVFSKKIIVQFDPSITNLEKIRKVLGSKN